MEHKIVTYREEQFDGRTWYRALGVAYSTLAELHKAYPDAVVQEEVAR